MMEPVEFSFTLSEEQKKAKQKRVAALIKQPQIKQWLKLLLLSKHIVEDFKIIAM